MLIYLDIVVHEYSHLLIGTLGGLKVCKVVVGTGLGIEINRFSFGLIPTSGGVQFELVPNNYYSLFMYLSGLIANVIVLLIVLCYQMPIGIKSIWIIHNFCCIGVTFAPNGDINKCREILKCLN
jgi:hypothetical protein